MADTLTVIDSKPLPTLTVKSSAALPSNEPEDELTKLNRQMTAAMSGQTTLLSPEEKAQAEAGKKAGMKAAVETVGGMVGGEAFGLPALKGLTGALVRMLTTGTGAAAGNVAGQVGTGQSPDFWEAAKAGLTWGGFQGAGEALSALGQVKNSLRDLIFTPEAKYTPVGKAIAHPVDASADFVLRKALGVPSTPVAPVKPESVPITRSPNFDPAAYKAGVAQRTGLQGQPELFQAPQPSAIATSGSQPPPINRTLVSYDRNLLVGMARHGDVDALRELIRNPGNIDVASAVPNARYMLEQGAPTNIYGGPK